MNSCSTTFKTPCAVPIVTVTSEHKFVLDEEALQKVLSAPNLSHRKVVIVSVVGAFRKGKSFLLNFFLRYLKARYVEKIESEDWLGNETETLDGFSWSGGSKRNTTGILIWSEAFLVDLENGDQLAIFLLDTQGTFDCESTVRDCATVFALSTMISSVQIYNLSQNIQEDDLQHLELFTEYGRLALAESGSVPFQKLLFLVRDWSFPYEHEYGADGGNVFLERRLRVSDTQNSEMQSLRTFIKSCFSSIECFLMPHPGLKVATNLDFQGRLNDIDDEFKQYIRQLAASVLSPQRLICKEMNGQMVKVLDLAFYFKSYIKAYSGNDLPEPKSMLVATAEANNLAAVADSRQHYMAKMESLCAPDKPYIKTANLAIQHEKLRDRALAVFDERKKMGGDTVSGRYREQLAADLDSLFVQFRNLNENKNAFKTWRTPAVLVTTLLVCYILCGFFSILGLYRLADSFNTFILISVVLLIVWSVSRYSGQYEEIGSAVDFIASFLWENILKPTYNKLKLSIAGEQVIGQMIEIGMQVQDPTNADKGGAPKMHQS